MRETEYTPVDRMRRVKVFKGIGPPNQFGVRTDVHVVTVTLQRSPAYRKPR